MRSPTSIIVSVPDQKMVVFSHGVRVAEYPVSTSKFGLGDRHRSYATPLGKLMVAQKVGANFPEGAVFKGRRPTGEVLKPNAKGRDPIVTRILYLRGMEPQNASAFERAIYIHGTPEEKRIGKPASYGCVRMKSRDVVKVFNAAPVGTVVEIVNTPMRPLLRQLAAQRRAGHSPS
jgi:lipoprotein-anchoring transpeptidase ErfK/SrfK